MGEFDRGGNLYQPKTLQGNWFEDREQHTVGSNDGLRCAQMAYKEMMDSQDVYHGPTREISMPATEYKGVSTQVRSVNLFPCTKYRHPKQLPTDRVLSVYNISPALRMTTTAMLMHHGEKRIYTGSTKRPIIDSTNMRETLKARPTGLPEQGWGAILPKYSTDLDLGVRYFNASYTNDFHKKEQKHSDTLIQAAQMTLSGSKGGADTLEGTGKHPSHHPQIPHQATVDEEDKGTVEDTGAGFVYSKAITFNPMPFPTRGKDGGDPWGRSREAKKGHFGGHHITSTCTMFTDARGIDPPRLGITIPGDTTMWQRNPNMPEPAPRKCLIAYAPKDNLTRRNGVHIWDDYQGHKGHF